MNVLNNFNGSKKNITKNDMDPYEIVTYLLLK